LLDQYIDNVERWGKLNRARPLVLACADCMPFKDKAFDFVVASHILEHMTDPARFLDELQRVGKAGYIETPHAFMERIIPYSFHRLRVRKEGGTLVITKKPKLVPDRELRDDFMSQLGQSRAF
jgi:ubiquinone/menaquinone biosynthesis C-methylase UbiE